MTGTAYDRVVDALRDHVPSVKANGSGALANCPAATHNGGDEHPSLALTRIEGSVLLHCRSQQCPVDDILTALDLAPRDLYDEPTGATYRYEDGRVVHRTPDKRFRQSGNTKGPPQLYRLEKVKPAVAAGQTVYIVEGEKDVLALETIGAVATCSPMGATSANKADWTPLTGAHVTIVPDRDQAGYKYTSVVVATLRDIAATLAIALPKTGKDAADHVAAGHTLDDLVPAQLPPAEEEIPVDDEPDELAEVDAAYRLARDVDRAARDIRVRELARAKVAAEKATEAPPFDDGLLEDVLARPTLPHRVEGLIPSEGGTLVVAQRKTGKTTLQLNLARSLLTGETFLGRFVVRPVDGIVGILNFEVSGAQLAHWADEAGVDRRRLYLVNLRGRRNPLSNDDDRVELTRRLRTREVETLIVDPFGRAYTGVSQNDPGEVGAWLADLDRWARSEAGVVDVVLSAHAGWNGERTRGSTALDDWADSIVTLVRDPGDDQQRFLKAEGRDVLIEEDQLAYDAATRRLTLAGTGSRKQSTRLRHYDELLPTVAEIVTAEPGITGYRLDQALKERGTPCSKGDGAKAAQLAISRDEMYDLPGQRGARKYFIGPPPHTSLDLPDGDVGRPPRPLSIEGGRLPGGHDDPPPGLSDERCKWLNTPTGWLARRSH